MTMYENTLENGGRQGRLRRLCAKALVRGEKQCLLMYSNIFFVVNLYQRCIGIFDRSYSLLLCIHTQTVTPYMKYQKYRWNRYKWTTKKSWSTNGNSPCEFYLAFLLFPWLLYGLITITGCGEETDQVMWELNELWVMRGGSKWNCTRPPPPITCCNFLVLLHAKSWRKQAGEAWLLTCLNH